MDRFHQLPAFTRAVIATVLVAVAGYGVAVAFFPAAPFALVLACIIAAIAFGGLLVVLYFVVVAGWNTWGHDPAAIENSWLASDTEIRTLPADADRHGPARR